MLTRRVLPATVLVVILTGGLRWLASDRGLIGQGTGVALMTLLAVGIVAGVTVWSARRIRAAMSSRLDAERHAQYRMLARNLPGGAVFLFDRDLRYVLAEGQNFAEVGLTPDELEGRTIWEALEPDVCAAVEPVYRAALAGETSTVEMPFRDHVYRVTVAPARDDAGEIAGGLVLTQRITEQKRLQEQLNQAQKMEAVGQLAGGVAHDFNNLLVAIRGYSELLREHPEDARAAGWVDEIVKASDHAASLTKQLLTFSRKQVVQPRLLNVNDVIGETTSLLDRLLGEQVEIVTALEPTLGPVKADPGHLHQVLVNLALNARDAMPGGGKLTIETANVVLDELFASEHLGAAPGQYVMCAVSDTGCGMDAETRSHIFEPFFTTKEAAGTGLGLSTVYGIVKQNDGYISVYSEPDVGTVFRIYLPLTSDLEPAAPPAPEPTPSTNGQGRILVVDDDDRVRGIIGAMLLEHGYETDIAAGAEEALSQAERSEYDLLITDIGIPGIDGRELAKRIAAGHPGIAVLYTSGYTSHTIEAELGTPGQFLPKPFTMKELTTAVQNLLEPA